MPSAGGASGGPEDPIPFRTVVRGSGEVVLQARLVRPIHLLTCKQPTTIQKQHDDGTWRPLRDERSSPGNSGGFYLDGVYQAQNPERPCDVAACVPYPGMQMIGSVLEYVQRGVVMAANGQFIPSIESSVPSSPLRVIVNYFEDPMCQQLVTTHVNLVVPEGVCCDFGRAGCHSGNPSGGWAVSYEECPGPTPDSERYYYQRPDAFGCTRLVPNEGRGCDEDAGVAQ